MRPNKIYIIPLLLLSIFSAECSSAQTTIKIPLVEGYENSSIQIADTTVEIARFYIIQEENYREVAAKLNISENDRQHSTSLYYSKGKADEISKNYPIAIGRHLFGLEINDNAPGTKPEVSLTIEQNDFGNPFFLDLDREATIGSLTVRFDNSITGRASRSPKEAFHDVGMAWIKLSEDGEEETITFDSDRLFAEKQLSFEWKSYRIWVLAYSGTSVQLKIDKKPIEQNGFGKPFSLGLRQEAAVGGLTVRFDEAVNETATYYPDGPEVCDTYIRFTASESSEQEVFSFMANELDEKSSLLFTWKGYRIWVSGCSEVALQLKVELCDPRP